MPIFRVESVKIYTDQKNLHWRHQWRQWQLSGMLFISSTGQNYLWPWYLTPIPCLFFFPLQKKYVFLFKYFPLFPFSFCFVSQGYRIWPSHNSCYSVPYQFSHAELSSPIWSSLCFFAFDWMSLLKSTKCSQKYLKSKKPLAIFS